MPLLELLAPEFGLIALGVALRRVMSASEEGWVFLEKLGYYLLFPCLLFVSILRAPGSVGAVLPMTLAAGSAAALGVAAAYACRWLPETDVRRRTSGAQTAFRFNSYLGMAIAERTGSAEGLALFSIMIAVLIPILNVAAVWPMAGLAQRGLVRELLRNPLIIATLGGLAWRAVQLPMPDLVLAVAGRMGIAALPLGLLCIGAALRWPRGDHRLAGSDRLLATSFTGIKLLLMPLAGLGACLLFGLDGLPALLVVMYTALPTSPASYVLASRMGGDGAFVAQLITISLLGALVSLPLWTGIGAFLWSS
ncbi:MAG: AEC family transporter [Betaproteobacteria bacterium]